MAVVDDISIQIAIAVQIAQQRLPTVIGADLCEVREIAGAIVEPDSILHAVLHDEGVQIAVAVEIAQRDIPRPRRAEALAAVVEHARAIVQPDSARPADGEEGIEVGISIQIAHGHAVGRRDAQALARGRQLACRQRGANARLPDVGRDGRAARLQHAGGNAGLEQLAGRERDLRREFDAPRAERARHVAVESGVDGEGLRGDARLVERRAKIRADRSPRGGGGAIGRRLGRDDSRPVEPEHVAIFHQKIDDEDVQIAVAVYIAQRLAVRGGSAAGNSIGREVSAAIVQPHEAIVAPIPDVGVHIAIAV